VRTFHALGREILRDAGRRVDRLVDRSDLLADLWPDRPAAEYARLDTAFSRLKLDLAVRTSDVEADPGAGPTARAWLDYERALVERDAIDFDDLVRGALDALDADATLLARWRDRCAHLLVDEVQDVDRSQLRLALTLAAPANRIFLVGDDDQSIYGWRLADVRRVLGLAAVLPGLRRVDLAVNHRCPIPVVDRAVRLIEHNRERFAKSIRARPDAAGSVILAPDPGDEPARTERLLRSWPDDGGTRAVLARTNRELRPAVLAAIGLGLAFRAPSVVLLVDDPVLDPILSRLARETDPSAHLLVRIGRLRRLRRDAPEAEREMLTALLAWGSAHGDLDGLIAAIAAMRSRLAALRRDDASLALATAHSTKGAEFDHVAVVGMDAGRFPSARAVGEADDPDRALEEERRLGYVAWTRARRTLTLSYDPGAPSSFLLEAFSPDELDLDVP
jgi:superfamily I DNA/RNA helicase